MTTTVRRAEPADLDTVAFLFSGYLEFYEKSHPPASVEAFLRERLTRRDSVVFLAFDESLDRAVGMAQVYPTFSSLSLARAWVLNDLFVDPGARGSGAGRALLREVCAAAKADGAAHVALETAEDNSRAQALYENEGFAQESGFRHYSRDV